MVALRSGDAATLARWREIVAESELAFRALYDRLGVLLTARTLRQGLDLLGIAAPERV